MWGVKKPRRKSKGSRVAWTALPTDLPPKKRELRPVWKSPDIENAVKNRPAPAEYQPIPTVSSGLEGSLVIGGTVVARHDLCLGERGVYPYPALIRFYGSPDASVPVPKGSLLMYAGCLRSVERKWVQEAQRYVNVQVHKHTFVTPFGRCIIHDFGLIREV